MWKLATFVVGLVGTACISVGADTMPTATREATANGHVLAVRLQGQPFTTADAQTYAGLGDKIIIDVVNLKQWLDLELKRSGKKPDPHKLVPVFNGVKLKGIYPDSVTTADAAPGADAFSELNYSLNWTNESKDDWPQLLHHPVHYRPVDVSLSFVDGDPMESYVAAKAKTESEPARESPFHLVIVRPAGIVFGLVFVLLFLTLFVWLAWGSDLIRDSSGWRRADGMRPYSLARTQMAFWLLIVVSAYLLLWIVTGAIDTIPGSVLTLIGISVGTALGAVIADNTGSGAGEVGPNAGAIALAGERSAIASAAEAEVKRLKSTLLPGNTLTDAEKLSTALKIEELQQQVAYCSWYAPRRVFHDLLSERGQVTFHRFQMLIWTIIIGCVFSYRVWDQLSMPVLDLTLLGLMGITAGTYVGFKLPPTRPPSITTAT